MSRTLKNLHRATTALVALAIWSCGGATPTGDAVGSVGAVVVSPPSSTLALNSTLPLQAEVHNLSGIVVSNLPVAWTVRDPSIASVSETGVVTGKSLGTTQVAASSGGKSGIATITVQKTPVASVSIQPNRVDAVVGSRNQLTGRAADEAGNVLADRAIIWTSSDAHVATVDGTGLVVAVGPGSATITGASEGKTATSVFTISQGAVASVTVTPSPVTMLTGQSTQLAASVRDAGGVVLGGKTVVWSSSNTAVATVASDGTVNAVGAGTATITATADGVSGTSAVTVSNIPVATVEVTPQGPSLTVGETRALTAVTRDAGGTKLENRSVTWSSSNPGVATVNNSAVVTALSAGTTIITATSEGKSGNTTVTVTPVAVGAVLVAPSTVSLTPTQTRTLTATVTDANGNALTGRTVTWSSSNDLIATVSQSGVVTGVLPGNVTITASSGGKNGTSAVTVTLVPVGSVSVSPTTRSLTVGQTGTFTATVADANGTALTNRPVEWTSDNTGIATVSSSGVVTAVSPGTATITASSGGKSGTATVTVTSPPAASVSVSPGTTSLTAGAGTTLTATVKDANGATIGGAPVTWSTSDASVAAVSSSGAVTTSKVGTATITASSGGQSGTATITVTPGAAATVTVTPKTASVKVNATTTLTATAVDAQGNAITGRTFTWSVTSGGNNANVSAGNPSSTATVTGKKTGSATITVSMEGKSTTAAITVTN